MSNPLHTKDFPSQKGPETSFTGDVLVQSLQSAKNVDVLVAQVTFAKGAYTHWHTHSQGQVLYFLEGKGRVEIEGQGVINAEVGDVVEIPANTRHWHGAHPEEDNHMTHLAITYGEINWMEEVKESDYSVK